MPLSRTCASTTCSAPGTLLTPAGQADADRARDGAAVADPVPPDDLPPADGPLPLLTPGVIAPPLRDPEARRKMGFHTADDAPNPVMAELNLRCEGGADGAFRRLDRLWERVTGGPGPTRISEQYATGSLSCSR